MKIGHFSDLHYCPAYLAEADRCFSFAIQDAIAHGIDVAILSGDATHHRLEVHSPALRLLAQRIQQLANHCPVLILQGTFSHDPPGMLHMLQMIGARHPIAIADRIGLVGLTTEGQWVEPACDASAALTLAVTCVPTVNKADLVPLVGAEDASAEMGNQLAAIMASFAPANDAYRDAGVPTVLVSHGTVQGSLNESGVPMAGLDHEFTIGALYSAHASAVMLGHIHKHQVWERNFAGIEQKIAYAGSPGRFHYGEIGDKVYLLWHLEANTVDIEPIVTPSRAMIDLEFPGAPDLDEIASVAAQCANAYVRVRCSVDAEHAPNVDRAGIRQILAAAAEVKIEVEVLSIQRQRCEGISRLPDLHSRFLRWCEISGTATEGLVERLDLLNTGEPEEIVARLLTQPEPPSAVASSDLSDRVRKDAIDVASGNDVEVPEEAAQASLSATATMHHQSPAALGDLLADLI
ncbi:metallophosphoesterase family protein [Noviherbaspirillum pedocola]|uniref:Metallophosphoesterase family protein n=1 Tax=Noviherbaspirillum pedocola TaxID=2801341 RepID=A0A934W7T1_9BURK|nr:metallophosphoesterase family protein [Noviherbaspirillum pedocola]MBK4735973.1 metallophosphoesterase family protein [Noviherbaspirillum pedocola]